MDKSLKMKILMMINYHGKASETFISDEIDCLSKQQNFDLDILHYGADIPQEKVYGLNMPASAKARWLKNSFRYLSTVFRSLKYLNGLNGSIPYFVNFFK